MSEEKQTRCCLWCGNLFPYVYSCKIYCSQACHSQSHYIRQRDFSHLSPKEFKQVLCNWIESGSHINPNHPLRKLNDAKAEVIRSATEVVRLVTDKLIEELVDAER
ncbi:MAG: hypothetical protein E6Q69_05510 [Aquipseudomonas alcaligenes]|uniref:Uncharacterized protein n=1 Tax=Aquipseudomonas alcaligenes TaxID=43263 RepID=A0A5C7W8D3_AQUAC|nr:MAG: hypothetical protein E6Q69_05510 [Pseudomonas alcaligenes]